MHVSSKVTVATCPIKMHAGKLCGRSIHLVGLGVDPEPVCLMHSKDPRKLEGGTAENKAFWVEVERILAAAVQEHEAMGSPSPPEVWADFQGFVFPEVNWSEKKIFTKSNFFYATFTGAAYFAAATFTGDAYFDCSTFSGPAYFPEATFSEKASFLSATFSGVASFYSATFFGKASFLSANFCGDAHFSRAAFSGPASCRYATFTGAAYFGSATFTGAADFGSATFTGAADFRSVTFTGDADFTSAKLHKTADFGFATFHQTARFVKTEFRADETLEPGPSFGWTKFEKPEKVLFSEVDLSRALFYRAEVTKLRFHNVNWRQRGKVSGSNKAGRKRGHLFEEDVDLGYLAAEGLKPGDGSPNERNYRVIGDLYQQLKKNYEERRDYATAGDFHYGEMEMRRLDSPYRGLRRRLDQNAGFTALYKYASSYGESLWKPALWLVGFLTIFALLYPTTGMLYDAEKDRGSQVQSVSQAAPVSSAAAAPGAPPVASRKVVEVSWWNPAVVPPQNTPAAYARARCELFLDGWMTALYIAAFQKDLIFEPSYRLGRVAALVEVALTSTLVALFLLAVRRRFQR